MFICQWTPPKLNASSREDYIPQTLPVLLEINSILCIYIWPLWPFVFCPSFVNNSLNNVLTLSTNQGFWLDSRQILHHQYGISMTELQPFFRAKHPQQRRTSRNGCFCRLLAVFQGLLVRSLCISQFQVHPCTPWATAGHLIARLVSPQILHGLEVRHLPIPGPPPSFCHTDAFFSKHNWTWRILWVVMLHPKVGEEAEPWEQAASTWFFFERFSLEQKLLFLFFLLEACCSCWLSLLLSLMTAIIEWIRLSRIWRIL